MSVRERGALALRLTTAAVKLGAYLAEDTGALARWEATFRDDIDEVLRARNNITVGASISMENLRSAVKLGERLADVAETVDDDPGG